MLSGVFGSVPLMNSSLTRFGQYGVGSRPEVPHTSTCTMPSGCLNCSTGMSFSANSMKSCQIGPAPVNPLERSMDELSLLPTQTPVTSCGVKPSVQLSLKSLVVPVLAAAGRDNFSDELAPNATLRAWLSDRMSVIRYVTFGSITSLTSGFWYW